MFVRSALFDLVNDAVDCLLRRLQLKLDRDRVQLKSDLSLAVLHPLLGSRLISARPLIDEGSGLALASEHFCRADYVFVSQSLLDCRFDVLSVPEMQSGLAAGANSTSTAVTVLREG